MIRSSIIAALLIGALHTITFNAVENADHYKVYFSRHADFRSRLVTTRTCDASPCTFTFHRPLRSGRTIYIQVVAVNVNGEGPM